jgi:hypothetical protein
MLALIRRKHPLLKRRFDPGGEEFARQWTKSVRGDPSHFVIHEPRAVKRPDRMHRRDLPELAVVIEVDVEFTGDVGSAVNAMRSGCDPRPHITRPRSPVVEMNGQSPLPRWPARLHMAVFMPVAS